MSTFQLIVTGIFVTFVIIGVGVFALFGGATGGGSVGKVVLWGTMDQQAMAKILDALGNQDGAFRDITYVQKNPATYQAEFVNAVASGVGPDLFMMTQEDIGAFGGKLQLIPYSAVGQGTFIASYLDEGQLFLTSQGELALPFSIDPLVMYWNRDLFAGAGQGQPPQYWNDFLTLAPKITSLDAGANVKKSAVALGTWSNVAHAKAILSALFMQSGEYITGRDASGGLVATLGSVAANGAASPAIDALRFYTEFANPSKATYSWNRSLPNSFNAFVGGQLAVYLGPASEYKVIAARNPNLRFGVAVVPQLQNAAPVTHGDITGVAIARGAQNPVGALAFAQKLTGPAAALAVAGQGLLPARRDISLDTAQSAARATFVQSSLIARSWADPSAPATDALFKEMIESVLSGKSDPSQAVYAAAQGLRQLIPGQ